VEEELSLFIRQVSFAFVTKELGPPGLRLKVDRL
jgi:hypothetical protein